MPGHDVTKVRPPAPDGALMVVDIGGGNTLLTADPVVKALARMLHQARARIAELEGRGGKPGPYVPLMHGAKWNVP